MRRESDSTVLAAYFVLACMVVLAVLTVVAVASAVQQEWFSGASDLTRRLSL